MADPITRYHDFILKSFADFFPQQSSSNFKILEFAQHFFMTIKVLTLTAIQIKIENLIHHDHDFIFIFFGIKVFNMVIVKRLDFMHILNDLKMLK